MALILVMGCGDKGSKKKSAEESPKVTETAPAPPVKTPATDEQVAHLVQDCVEQGVAAGKCACAGEAAKTAIGSVLAVKMSKQPAADDPAMQSYYTRDEINTVMAWIHGSSASCGIEEVN